MEMNALFFEMLGEKLDLIPVTTQDSFYRDQDEIEGFSTEVVGVFNEAKLEVILQVEERPAGNLVRQKSGKKYSIVHDDESPANINIPGKLDLWEVKLSEAE